MRILHVFDHSLPLQSGYVYRSLGILGAQRSLGWETVHLTGPRHNAGAPAIETINGWRFLRTPKPPGIVRRMPLAREVAEMRTCQARIAAAISSDAPDIVHAHSPVLTGWPALRAARDAGLPLVYEVRSLWEDAAVDLGHCREGDFRYRATRFFETRLLRRADAVVTLCEAMRREIASRGVSEDRIIVVPNAVPSVGSLNERPKDQALLARLGLQGRTILGFIGSFYHYEGLELLIAALPEICRHRPNIAVLLVGGGPMEAALRHQVATAGLEDRVRMPGYVPHAEVSSYYDLIDALVFPRRRMRLTELVTPLKPVEAMSEARLVLASDVGGHRELVSDGVTGFLFAADDQAALSSRVLHVLGLPADELARVRFAGRQFVAAERVWAKAAARYAPVYKRLVSRRAFRRFSLRSPRLGAMS